MKPFQLFLVCLCFKIFSQSFGSDFTSYTYCVNTYFTLCVFAVNALFLGQQKLNSARVSFGRRELKVLQMKINEDCKRAEHEFISSKPSQASHTLCLSSSWQLPEVSVCFLNKYPRNMLSVLYKTSQLCYISTPRGGFFTASDLQSLTKTASDEQFS